MRFTSNEYLSLINTSYNKTGSFWLNIFMSDAETKIIMLSQLLADKASKEKELQYYQHVLEDLLVKMNTVRREINLTETIIDIIKDERADLIEDFIKERDEERVLDVPR